MTEIEFIAFVIATVGVPVTACALIIRHLREKEQERQFQEAKAHYLILSMIREQVSRQARVACYNCGNEIIGPAVMIDNLPYCKGCGRFPSDDPDERLDKLNEFRQALGSKNTKETDAALSFHHPVTQSTPVNNDYCRYCGTWLDGKHSCSACGAPRGR